MQKTEPNSNGTDGRQAPVDRVVFSLSVVVILGLCVVLVSNPGRGTALLKEALDFVTQRFGWLYLWFGLAATGVLAWLAFGRYGKVKLGDPTDKPEFSTLSWVAMLFCAGIGTGVLYWGAIEWAYYFDAPPFGVAPRSNEAAEWAATYGLFHWGLGGWCIYCLPTIPIAYAYYVRKERCLRLSSACRGVLGKHADGPLGKAIDIFFMFGLVGGVGTSLGLGTPMLSEGLGRLLGVPRDFGLDCVIIVLWTLAFGASVYLGLEKGIKRLSDINVYLALALVALILVAGPTLFIIKTFSNSVGLLVQNHLRMSLYTDPITQSGFPEKWTVFYWAWFITYAPFMGLFVTRISRGRTIRQLIVGECLGGILGCWLIFAALGNTALYFELNGVLSTTEILREQGAAAAIISVVQALPIGTVALVVFVILAFVFLATCLDSAAFTLAAVASRDLSAGREPARWHRLLWAFLLGAVALVLMYLGGLEALQTSSVVAALPLVFVLGLMVVSLLRWLRQHEQHQESPGEHAAVVTIDAGPRDRRERSATTGVRRPAPMTAAEQSTA